MGQGEAGEGGREDQGAGGQGGQDQGAQHREEEDAAAPRQEPGGAVQEDNQQPRHLLETLDRAANTAADRAEEQGEWPVFPCPVSILY